MQRVLCGRWNKRWTKHTTLHQNVAQIGDFSVGLAQAGFFAHINRSPVGVADTVTVHCHPHTSRAE